MGTHTKNQISLSHIKSSVSPSLCCAHKLFDKLPLREVRPKHKHLNIFLSWWVSVEMMYEQQQQQPLKPKIVKKMERKRSNVGEDQKLHVLELSGMSLDSLPNPSMINLATIWKLDLSNNNLQSIPESLTARLLNVAVLDVHSNQLKSLPNSIGCLSKLKVLNVAGNLLQCLPRTLENCKSLEELNANFNQLSKLPDTIGFELNLKKLSVNSNKLIFLPHSLTHMTSLRVLDVRLNCLRSLPEDLENLINLEVLNVSQNFHYLDALPYSVGLLLSLVELDVSYNKITSLPDSIGCLKKLQKLSVQGNPLVSPPMEVVEQSLGAVKEYLSQKMNGGHKSAPKKRSWVGKLVKYGTFTGRNVNVSEEREGFIMPQYRPIDSLASPRYMGMFSPRIASTSSYMGMLSPRRLFSPRSYSR